MASGKRRTVTKAQRAQIIQRVIVDGWSCAEAGAAHEIEGRLVAVWVADYRRHGMASLHRVPRETVAAEIVERRLSRPLLAFVRRSIGAVRRLLRADPSPPPSPPHRSLDKPRGTTALLNHNRESDSVGRL